MTIYGEAERAAAHALAEGELRMRLDVLLEQCGREAASQPYQRGFPGIREPFLYVSEILALLGLGPSLRYTALEELLAAGVGSLESDPDRVCNDLRCRFGRGHTGPCPDPLPPERRCICSAYDSFVLADCPVHGSKGEKR